MFTTRKFSEQCKTGVVSVSEAAAFVKFFYKDTTELYNAMCKYALYLVEEISMHVDPEKSYVCEDGEVGIVHKGGEIDGFIYEDVWFYEIDNRIYITDYDSEVSYYGDEFATFDQLVFVAMKMDRPISSMNCYDMWMKPRHEHGPMLVCNGHSAPMKRRSWDTIDEKFSNECVINIPFSVNNEAVDIAAEAINEGRMYILAEMPAKVAVEVVKIFEYLGIKF